MGPSENTFMASIGMFGGNFAPRGWAFCNGQLQSIAQNTALFSLLGTTYGGDGRTTFQLPDFRSRVPIHAGQGNGLSGYKLGQIGGAETVKLNKNSLPQHNHNIVKQSVNLTTALIPGKNETGKNANPPSSSPIGNYLGGSGTTAHIYRKNPDLTAGASIKGVEVNGTVTGQTEKTGAGIPFGIIQPYLAISFCIALQGVYPSRS